MKKGAVKHLMFCLSGLRYQAIPAFTFKRPACNSGSVYPLSCSSR